MSGSVVDEPAYVQAGVVIDRHGAYRGVALIDETVPLVLSASAPLPLRLPGTVICGGVVSTVHVRVFSPPTLPAASVVWMVCSRPPTDTTSTSVRVALAPLEGCTPDLACVFVSGGTPEETGRALVRAAGGVPAPHRGRASHR